jgi:protein-S-isoprenylcysteine O-methyltransferase Ste14
MPQRRMTESIERQGEWLFRHRGGIGLAILPALIAATIWPGPPGSFLSDAATDDVTVAGMAISTVGLALRWLTVGFVPADTSGRNTREQRAGQLNTDSAYSLVRHPLYMANGIVLLGFAVAVASAWFILLMVPLYALTIERIVAAEEDYLARLYGDAYGTCVAGTPAFLPDFARWRPPNLPLSGRTILRREYNGVLGMALAYFGLEALRDLWVGGQSWAEWVRDDGLWFWVLGIGLASFVVLRTIKRATRWLHVSGR